MDFYLSPQFKFDTSMSMNTNRSLGFVEEEDDEFFAEMRRQIMILTGDHNDEIPETKFVKPSYSSVTKPCRLTSTTSSSQGNVSLWQNEYTANSIAVPVQPAKPLGNSTGTGVFIPQSTASYRRNYRPSMPKSGGRMNDKKTYKQVENKP